MDEIRAICSHSSTTESHNSRTFVIRAEIKMCNDGMDKD